jgi:uncharacterized lipoprotein YddW (UPF0748 family)
MKFRYTSFSLILLFFTPLSWSQPVAEFRGVWIATVSNIDWPQSKSNDPEKQKADFIRLADMHKRNGMNVLVMQIRPAADAFYPSTLEPWSEFLTGKQGEAPNPYYDPLQFMIEETHKRGMEFHAWLNPYRAVFNINASSIAPDHVTRKHPEWFLTYGDKKYFDPGNKQAQAFVTSVVRDIVKRYSVDAIHMDDYFYPYRIPGKEFPDEGSFQRAGTSLSKDDLRRSNCDSIIVAIHRVIRAERPECRFGISPFSVWRNKSKDPEGSDSRAGVTNYDDLYADILLWLKKGWIDYVTPQLYLEIGHDKIAYEKLLDWWGKHSYGKHVYIGHGIYRAGEANSLKWKNPNELPNQIKLLRDNPNVQGSIYFSSKSFEKNFNGWNDSLRNNYYKEPALIPATPWLSKGKPNTPKAAVLTNGSKQATIEVLTDAKKEKQIKYYVVYKQASATAAKKIAAILPATQPLKWTDPLNDNETSVRYFITAVNQTNEESSPLEKKLTRTPSQTWTIQ